MVFAIFPTMESAHRESNKNHFTDTFQTQVNREVNKQNHYTYNGSVARAFATNLGSMRFKFNVSILGTRMHASFGSGV